jgi:hypothetical protein
MQYLTEVKQFNEVTNMAMDFKQGLSKQITKINVKTASFLEETKVKTYISTLEEEIKELKCAAGETGYMMWAKGENPGTALTEIYEKISRKYQTIQEQKAELQKLGEKNNQILGTGEGTVNNSIFCPNCGKTCPANVNFCVSCGTRLK